MRRALLLSLTGCVVVSLTACSSPAPTPDTTLPPPSRVEAVVDLPDPAKLASLDRLLTALLAGEEPAAHLVGDRLLVITPDTFSEIPRAATEVFLGSEFSLGGGCAGPCMVRVEDFLTSVLRDLRAGALTEAPVARPGSLMSWTPVVFTATDRTWRAHLSADAAALVAVEYFGPVPLPG